MHWLKKELDNLVNQSLFRSERVIESAQDPHVIINGKEYILFCSNNYLGLANHPGVKQAAVSGVERYGVGSGASRLVSGSLRLHRELEERLAKLKKTEAALIFSSGYLANLGVISALLDKEAAVIIDRLNHASIIDGCKLSGAKLLVYPHKDLRKLEKILESAGKFRRRLVITDTVFSMDGDLAPVEEIYKLAKKHDAWLMIDDAHATGIFPPHKADIIMGTLSKAIGSLGGFVCGSKDLIEYLRNKARSFIYTTALPPAVCAAALAALDLIENEPELVQSLWKKVKFVKANLVKLGFEIMNSESQIIPILIGENEKTIQISNHLFENGIFAQGIRPPAVPKGMARLRLTVMATHSWSDLEKLIQCLSL